MYDLGFENNPLGAENCMSSKFENLKLLDSYTYTQISKILIKWKGSMKENRNWKVGAEVRMPRSMISFKEEKLKQIEVLNKYSE